LTKFDHPFYQASDSASVADSLASPPRSSSLFFASGVEGTELLHVDWVQELPEDLDVCIAQRDFEGAVDLVQKSMLLFN
jgi:exocyst complex component 8